MSVSDLQITSRVKSVLTRHWVDQRELQCSVHGGAVRLRGEAKRLATSEAESLDVAALEGIVQELRRLPGVRKVYFLDVRVKAAEDTRPRMELDSEVSSYRLEIAEED